MYQAKHDPRVVEGLDEVKFVEGVGIVGSVYKPEDERFVNVVDKIIWGKDMPKCTH